MITREGPKRLITCSCGRMRRCGGAAAAAGPGPLRLPQTRRRRRPMPLRQPPAPLHWLAMCHRSYRCLRSSRPRRCRVARRRCCLALLPAICRLPRRHRRQPRRQQRRLRCGGGGASAGARLPGWRLRPASCVQAVLGWWPPAGAAQESRQGCHLRPAAAAALMWPDSRPAQAAVWISVNRCDSRFRLSLAQRTE